MGEEYPVDDRTADRPVPENLNAVDDSAEQDSDEGWVAPEVLAARRGDAAEFGKDLGIDTNEGE